MVCCEKKCWEQKLYKQLSTYFSFKFKKPGHLNFCSGSSNSQYISTIRRKKVIQLDWQTSIYLSSIKTICIISFSIKVAASIFCFCQLHLSERFAITLGVLSCGMAWVNAIILSLSQNLRQKPDWCYLDDILVQVSTGKQDKKHQNIYGN